MMNEATNNQNEPDASQLITASIKRKLELMEKYSDQISGLRSEIEYHSFDVLKYGGHAHFERMRKTLGINSSDSTDLDEKSNDVITFRFQESEK